jgi:acetyltransferase-like isoleucine patch superfamily enzyme
MRKKIVLYVRSFFSIFHVAVIKIFNITSFHSPPVQDLSTGTKFSLYGGKIFLKKHVHTRRNVLLETDGGCLEIGEGCFFNSGCTVVSKERISIGNYTALGPNVMVYDHDHDIRSGKTLHESGYVTDAVIIGNNVWIGANSVILRGSVIGDGCVIGAGCVIKGEYPPNSVVVQKREETVTVKNVPETEVTEVA